MKRTIAVAVLAWLCVVAHAAPAHAAPIVYDVTLDTSALVGSTDGPFSLNFQLIDGGGAATNAATFSDFHFGSGGATGSPILVGGATGDLSSSVSLTDDGGSFFNMFMQSFDPGTVLSFTILLTTEVEPGGIPDQLSMGILSATGAIPTEFFDAFFTIDVNSAEPSVQSFSSDPTSGIAIGAPSVTPTPVPEPASMTLLGIGLFCYFFLVRILSPLGRRIFISPFATSNAKKTSGSILNVF